MDDLSTTLHAIQLLVSPSISSTEQTTTVTVSTESPLVEHLRINLKTYRNTLSGTKYEELSKQLNQIRSQKFNSFTSSASTISDPLAVYQEFVREGLCLVSVLNDTLQILDQRDEEERLSSKSSIPPPAPRAILSISDIKSVHSLVQFLVSLGLYPYLLPGIDGSLRLRLTHVKSVVKVDNVSNQTRSFFLYHCVLVLLQLFENPILGPSVLSQHFPDVLAALIQISYGPYEDRQPNNTASRTGECEEDQSLVKTAETRLSSVETSQKAVFTPGDIGDQYSHSSSRHTTPSPQVSPDGGSHDFTITQKYWTLETLQRLLKQTYQPLVIRELLTLQAMSSKQPPIAVKANQAVKMVGPTKSGSKVRRQTWVRKVCGQLLSERLMDKNGVKNVVKGIFDSTATASGDSWRKCQSVAKVIASCPAQATSIEDYYSLVCPQVLDLVRPSQQGTADDFVKVGIATMSVMMSDQSTLSVQYLIEPLLQPIHQITSGTQLSGTSTSVIGKSLVACINHLHMICCNTELSSPLFSALPPYLPLFFDVWLAGSDEHNTSLKSKEILLRVAKSTDSPTLLSFICHVSQFQPSLSETVVIPSTFKSLEPTISLQYTTVGQHPELTVSTLTEKEVHDRRNVEEMERVGNGVVALLSSEFKQDDLVGLFFIQCMEHLASVLASQTGINQTSTDSFENTKTLSDQSKCGPNSTFNKRSVSISQNVSFSSVLHPHVSNPSPPPNTQSTSSALLDCESRLPPSHSETFTNSLVLYVTAAICESLSSTLLEQASLPDLISLINTVVSCHASYVQDKTKRTTNLLANVETTGDILGGPITLSVALGLLSAILSGVIEVKRQHRPLLAQIQPSLVTIATSYPDGELATLANDLNICVATLGAVWTNEGEDKSVPLSSRSKLSQAMKVGTSSKTNEKSSFEVPHKVPSSKRKNPRPLVEPSRESAGLQPLEKTKSPESRTLFEKALEDVNYPLVPVKGHGLLSLTKLIQSRDKETLSDPHRVLAIFREHLNHTDSYIYLAAINGLVSLSSIPDVRGSVISCVCQGYAQLSGAPSRDDNSLVNLETGRLKKTNHQASIQNVSNTKTPSLDPSVVNDEGHVFQSKEKISELGESNTSQSQYEVELRMKLGEALVKVARACGDLLPHYLDEITAAIFSNVKDPNPLIRASCLSNLANICASVKFSFGQIQNEVLGCVTSVLETEQEVKVRQAALLTLKLMFIGLSCDTVQVLGGSLREVYRLLKHVESSDQDELTRVHAQAALGELDKVMRDYIFPQQSRELTKKISILDL